MNSKPADAIYLSSLPQPYQLKRFKKFLFSTLPYKYGLKVSGSWALGEAHLPSKKDGLIFSFSDVDIVTMLELEQRHITMVSNKVKSLAYSCGLIIKNVSIRSGNEMMTLWNIRKLKHVTDRYTFAKDRFLAFWTVMAGIETAILEKVYASEPFPVLSYGLAKFFFKLSRNLCILKGNESICYYSIANAIYNLYPCSAITLAYKIKTGDLDELTTSDAKMLLSRRYINMVASQIYDEDMASIVVAICEHILSWHAYQKQLPISEYFEYANTLAGDSHLRDVLKRALEKYHSAKGCE